VEEVSVTHLSKTIHQYNGVSGTAVHRGVLLQLLLCNTAEIFSINCMHPIYFWHKLQLKVGLTELRCKAIHTSTSNMQDTLLAQI